MTNETLPPFHTWDKELISRDEARRLGLGKFYTGAPCPHGHWAERNTDNGRCCECKRIQKAKWHKKNRDAIHAKKAVYRSKNKEKISEKDKRYAATNKEKVRVKNARRRAVERMARDESADNIDVQFIEFLFSSQNGKCVYCNSSLKDGYHIDHIEPISGGGLHIASNIQLLCVPCNCSKGAKDPIDFAREKGLLL